MTEFPDTRHPTPDTLIKESHFRSFLKGFTWRIVATSTTILITYIITGKVETALKVGALEFVGKIFIYYLHERIWQLVPRGTIQGWLRKKWRRGK